MQVFAWPIVHAPECIHADTLYCAGQIDDVSVVASVEGFGTNAGHTLGHLYLSYQLTIISTPRSQIVPVIIIVHLARASNGKLEGGLLNVLTHL